MTNPLRYTYMLSSHLQKCVEKFSLIAWRATCSTSYMYQWSIWILWAVYARWHRNPLEPCFCWCIQGDDMHWPFTSSKPCARLSTSILVNKVPAPPKIKKKKKGIQRWENVPFLPVHPTKLVFLRQCFISGQDRDAAAVHVHLVWGMVASHRETQEPQAAKGY